LNIDRPIAKCAAETIDLLLEASVVGSFSRIGYDIRRRVFGWHDPAPDALAGRIALVTGASSGLGRAAALGFARAGATVVLLGRDEDRTARARDELKVESGNDDLHVLVADLSRLATVRRAADELLRLLPRLDVVVHNAGTLVHDFERTADGIELTAQVHVVAPFLLTARLLPLLEQTSSSRVVTVVSGGMYTTRLDVRSLDHPDGEFDGVKAYALAKRAQVVLNEQWAARTSGTGIEFQAMHPGWADTAGLKASLPRFHRVLQPILRSPAQGVDTTIWLATDDHHNPNGRLWLDRHPRRTTRVPGTRTRPDEADRLWRWCCDRADLDDPRAFAGSRPPAAVVVDTEVG
jgi:dehydrogenase/reductase SDR family protein 12